MLDFHIHFVVDNIPNKSWTRVDIVLNSHTLFCPDKSELKSQSSFWSHVSSNYNWNSQ
jgi:hypothetical protein